MVELPAPVEVSEDLARLAEAYGVATQYWDQSGGLVHVSATTVNAVLTALGVRVEGVDAVEVGLEQIRLRDWRRMLPSVFVTRAGSEERLWVHVPHGTPVEAWVECEDGAHRTLTQADHWVEPISVDGQLIGEASFTLPGDLPLGWHTIVAQTAGVRATSVLAVTPPRLHPQAALGERQWGFMAQIYATRSRDSWGLGDLRDCADLAAWSGRELGAGFLLINPLHAAAPTAPMSPSPYLPVTRRFANPMYIRIEDIPEIDGVEPLMRAQIEVLAQELRRRNTTADLLDRDAVWAAKRVVLEAIAVVSLSPERMSALQSFRAREGQGLIDFATWCALCDVFGNVPSRWPAGLASPASPAVEQFRIAHQSGIDFHVWTQWLVDEQLERTQRVALEAGMAVGLVHDLAVGVHPDGSDAWALQSVLASGVSVGAPPDMYNQMGQDWSQPPWHPQALADAAFIPYRDMLRTVLRHAGGLRIDHVLGLFRMWWVPRGMAAQAGTFVRFDHEAMIGILCLEAHRAGAVVIGEDLGTVEPWVQEALADRGILGTSVLWFESRGDGSVTPPAEWRTEVLASVTVHDLPPTAGFLRNEHVRIRSELNLLTRDVADELADAARVRAGWVQVLVEGGWLDGATDVSTSEGLDAVAVALHRALAASPARMIGVSLPDVVGDRRAQNQPGTNQEYPNWRVPMTDSTGRPVVLEDLYERPALLAAFMAAVRATAAPSQPLGL
jgi:4-alpha-glucanotransferase